VLGGTAFGALAAGDTQTTPFIGTGPYVRVPETSNTIA